MLGVSRFRLAILLGCSALILVLVLGNRIWRFFSQATDDLQAVQFYTEILTPSGVPFVFENPNSPFLAEIRSREKLDGILRGIGNEEKPFALLRWAYSQLKPGVPDPYTPWDARFILRQTREKGLESYCAQYAIVFGQACWACGIPFRYVDLNIASGKSGHFSTEVWSRRHKKWFFLDAINGDYFVRGGIPLSVLELHRAGKRNEHSGIRILSALKPESPPQRIRAQRLEIFYQYAVVMRNNHLTNPERIKLLPSDSEGPSLLLWSDTLLYWTDAGSKPILFEDKYRQHTYSGNPDDFVWSPDPILVDLEQTKEKGKFRLRFRCFFGGCGNFVVTGHDDKVLSSEGNSFEWKPSPAEPILSVRVAGEKEAPLRRAKLKAVFAPSRHLFKAIKNNLTGSLR